MLFCGGTMDTMLEVGVICQMQPGENSQRLLWKRRRLLVLLTLLICLVVVLVGLRSYSPTHPQFGAIYEATAFDLNEARSDRLAVFLWGHLPQRVVRSPNFPSRFKDQPRYLH